MQATAANVENASVDLHTELSAAFGAAARAMPGSFADREAATLTLANQLVRDGLETMLQDESRRFETGEVTVDGVRYRRHQRGVGTYHSLCGPVRAERYTFRQVGVHNGPTVVPLELSVGMIEHATPALALSVIQGYAAMPLRHYEQEMRAAYREPPSRSTLERLGKSVGAVMKQTLPSVEPLIRSEESIPDGTVSISIGLDRTSVPMAEPRDTRCRRERTKPYVRQPPAPVEVNYRMAYVGTMAFHDSTGEVVGTKRYAATAGEGPAELVRRLFEDVQHVRDRCHEIPLTVVQDGAPELWNLISEACERKNITPAAMLIDRFHVDERLAKLVEAFAPSDAVAHRVRARWRKSLERNDNAMRGICRYLNKLSSVYAFAIPGGEPLPPRWRTYARLHLKPELAAEFCSHIDYLERHQSKMRYASARKRGLPIGSGVTEGACKSVVTARFKRSGQRWVEAGLSSCLELRALHLSERLQPCFTHVRTSYIRDVRPI